MSYPAFAESLKITEAEFLRRELGLSLIPFESLADVKDLPSTLILILKSPSEILEQVLDMNASLIVLVLGDEKYRSDLFFKLDKAENVLRVYTPYFPTKPRTSMILRMVAGSILDGGIRFRAPAGGILRTLINGARKWRSTADLSKFAKVRQIPLGYTNRFVEELSSLGIIRQDSNSLFERAPLRIPGFRTKNVSFVGTRDSWCRDIAISHLKRAIFSDSITGTFSIDPKWGGGSNLKVNDYSSSIIDSDAVLCPPGYSSNFTFRFWECLLLGTFPISLPLTTQDWHLWQPNAWRNETIKRISAFSWRRQISTFGRNSFDQSTYRGLVNSALDEGRDQLSAARRFIEASI